MVHKQQGQNPASVFVAVELTEHVAGCKGPLTWGRLDLLGEGWGRHSSFAV